MIIHEVFEALANICKNASRDEIRECLLAARHEATNQGNYELVAAFRDLSDSLTGDSKTIPKPQPDEPKKGEQGS